MLYWTLLTGAAFFRSDATAPHRVVRREMFQTQLHSSPLEEERHVASFADSASVGKAAARRSRAGNYIGDRKLNWPLGSATTDSADDEMLPSALCVKMENHDDDINSIAGEYRLLTPDISTGSSLPEKLDGARVWQMTQSHTRQIFRHGGMWNIGNAEKKGNGTL